jgi:hypothetical protein
MNNESRYTVTITEHGSEKRTCGTEWEEGAGKDGSYGYTPEIEKTVEFSRDVFKQNTEALNLVEVIKAVNGLIGEQK